MTDRTYKVSFELFVDGRWIDDGLNAKTLERRIKEELPSDLCSSAYGSEIVVRNIRVCKKV